jgi:UDP-N-acetylglucosamine acyltransferase
MTTKMQRSTKIHPTALVHDDARVGNDVEIGAYAIVGERCVLGDGCVIAPRASLERDVKLGTGVKIGVGSVIGGDPQDLKYAGRTHDRRDRRQHDDSRIRHHQSRHDAVVQDDGGEELLHHVLRAFGARLSHRRRRDHVERCAARRARDGGRQGDHFRAHRRTPVREDRTVQLHRWHVARAQGRGAIREGVGNPIKLYGLNAVGLERNGFPEDVRRELKRAYRLFFKSELNLSQARERAAAELHMYPEVEEFLRFFDTSDRGLVI